MNENGIMPTFDMNRDDGFGGSNWLWVILLFFFFGFGNNGFGGNGQQNVNDQFLTRDLFGNQKETLETRYTNQLGLQNLGQQLSSCCCETNRNIDAVRADSYKNTCEITTAIHAEGEQTRALINANTMQELRDKLSDRDRDLLVAELAFRGDQNVSRVISTLQPTPKPAYLSCSPYAPQPNPYSPYGYGYGYYGSSTNA